MGILRCTHCESVVEDLYSFCRKSSVTRAKEGEFRHITIRYHNTRVAYCYMVTYCHCLRAGTVLIQGATVCSIKRAGCVKNEVLMCPKWASGLGPRASGLDDRTSTLNCLSNQEFSLAALG
jgi:hypothetical protein